MLAAGPTFNLHYGGGLYFNKYNETTPITKTPTFSPDQKVFLSPSGIPATVLTILSDDGTKYTLLYDNTHDIMNMMNPKYLRLRRLLA